MSLPAPPRLEFAFAVRIRLRPALYMGKSPLGHERAAVYLEDGEFEGPGIRGRVLSGSGGDWAVVRPDGVLDFDARYVLQTDDGVSIYMQNRGYRWGSEEVMARMRRREPVDPSEYYMRASPKFEVQSGPYDWLMRYVFVGVADKTPEGNVIRYFKVL
ncbi:DUF3237 domain-containing protein [Luteimonas sp. BDR2-5]|uniref:DUF3237 domain-containing protein n=1 Tax=Proluteimonas luteida TaxID=2878685 RepID=UPI001E3DC354|nr:DUF3237 domain-containing protein [Luteimonas sp. BDR2-5]MCD9028722.1 DUF3237 domain-containing protein [Luteimonas sp. BDR2-5]